MKENKKYYDFGYNQLWEILYWFSYFIFRQTYQYKDKNIYFASRDWLNFLPLVKLIYKHNNMDYSDLKTILLSRKVLSKFLKWDKNNVSWYLLKKLNKKENFIIDIWYKGTSHKYIKEILKGEDKQINFKTIFLIKKYYNELEDEILWFLWEGKTWENTLQIRSFTRNSWGLEMVLWDYAKWSVYWFRKNLSPLLLPEKASQEQISKVKIMFEWVQDFIKNALENNIKPKLTSKLLNKTYELFSFPKKEMVDLFKDFSFADSVEKWKVIQVKIFNNIEIWTILDKKWKENSFDIWHRNPWIWWKMSLDKLSFEEKKLHYEKILSWKITIVSWKKWNLDLEKICPICE